MKNQIRTALFGLGMLAAMAVLPSAAQAKTPEFQFTLEEAAMLAFEMELNDDEILDLYFDGLIDEETTMLLLDMNGKDAELSGTDLGSGRFKSVSGMDLGSGRFKGLSGTDLGSGR